MASVLITGASTGIGRQCALDLARAGWQVFAGIRNPEDGEALVSAGIGHIIPVIIDVTDTDTIGRAVKKIETDLAGKGLDALVNNAGITVQGPLEFVPLAMFETQMQVNVTGQLAVTQAFLPLIRGKTALRKRVETFDPAARKDQQGEERRDAAISSVYGKACFAALTMTKRR